MKNKTVYIHIHVLIDGEHIGIHAANSFVHNEWLDREREQNRHAYSKLI